MLVTAIAAGDSAIASASIGRRFDFEILPATTPAGLNGAVASLEIDGLPSVFMWVRQTSGLIGCTFQPLFSVNVAQPSLNPNPANPEWLPLTVPTAIPITIPIFFTDRLSGVSAIGLQLVTPAGATNSVFEVVIGASQ